MQQLSLLDLPPIEDEPASIVVIPAPVSASVNPHELAWLQAKAGFYLRLMNKFMDGHKCRQEVRSAELVRIYELREQVLATIEEMER